MSHIRITHVLDSTDILYCTSCSVRINNPELYSLKGNSEQEEEEGTLSTLTKFMTFIYSYLMAVYTRNLHLHNVSIKLHTYCVMPCTGSWISLRMIVYQIITFKLIPVSIWHPILPSQALVLHLLGHHWKDKEDVLHGESLAIAQKEPQCGEWQRLKGHVHCNHITNEPVVLNSSLSHTVCSDNMTLSHYCTLETNWVFNEF